MLYERPSGHALPEDLASHSRRCHRTPEQAGLDESFARTVAPIRVAHGVSMRPLRWLACRPPAEHPASMALHDWREAGRHCGFRRVAARQATHCYGKTSQADVSTGALARAREVE